VDDLKLHARTTGSLTIKAVLANENDRCNVRGAVKAYLLARYKIVPEFPGNERMIHSSLARNRGKVERHFGKLDKSE
jgi:hypothetical protein